MIDELIHSCIEQIGLDGEAGTDIDRLADFIRQYHTEHSSRSQLPDQLVDLAYQAFIFRQLLRHPDVSVGLFVPGVPVKSGAKSVDPSTWGQPSAFFGNSMVSLPSFFIQ